MNHCKTCEKQTTNAKYCSRSCAVSASNKTSIKRKASAKRSCRDCGIEYMLRDRRKTRCAECFDKNLYRYDRQTLGEIEQKTIDAGTHISWRWSTVRAHCRKVNQHRPMKCQVCGYSNHVEMCHIKPLSKSPKDATLAEVNASDNIFILCPNHHWEFDNQLLTEAFIRSL